jgi:transcriptional regulator with XRE-family HTH domain
MSDHQGTLKEQIIAATQGHKPWEVIRSTQSTNRPPKKIRPRHRMAAALQAAGFTNKEIAEKLGYTEGRISVILRSKHPQLQEVRKEIADRIALETGDMALRFHMEAPKSLDTLINIRDNAQSPTSERRQSALAILDRAGYTPIKKQINLQGNVPAPELREVITELDRANEVFERRREWEVKSLPTGTGG